MISDEENSYYVFNVGNDDGFVIVSGDDRTPEILGYADNGHLYKDDMPDGLRYLLDGYAEQIEWMDSHGFDETYEACASRTSRKAPARTAIAPLIQTKWNQGTPYNAYCPILTDGTRTVTGCVATCMAQIMYYHKWPTSATASIPGYATRNGKFTLDGLDAFTFDWNNMLLVYGSANDTQKEAVAKLMQYCGYSLQMNYNTSSSALSESIAEALRLYFGYSNDIDYVKRNAYSYTEWIDLIYSELAASRPVALAGQAVGSGHSFVCDGYQGDDYFHINWGWGGTSDGYFRLTALNPEEQGIGGSSTLDGFSFGQDAVIGIHPASTGESTAVTQLTLVELQFEATDATNNMTFTRSSQSEDFTGIPLRFSMGCITPGENTFTVAAQVKDTAGDIKQTVTIESASLEFAYTYNFTNTIDLGKDLGDGTYYIYIVSCMGEAGAWQPSYGSAKLHYTAVISNNNLTLTTPVLVEGDNPTLVSISASPETPTLGDEVNVTARLTGGRSNYHDDLKLYVNGKVVMGKQADIPAGETVDVHFVYTPSAAGSNTLAIYAGNTKLGSEKTISVTDDGSTMALTLGLNATISNTYEDNGTTYYYGNGIRATITVTNSSTEHAYRGIVNCSVRTWDGDNYVGNATSYLVTVPKNNGTTDGSTNIPIVVDGLTPGGTYNLRITYYTVKDGKKQLAENEIQTVKYVMGNGYALYNADGSKSLHQASNNINAGSAYFVDMSGLSNTGSLNVTPSTNPNCLYLLDDDASTPTGLTAKNVVKGTMAENIALTDGNDFYSPIDFTATNISYTRTFTRAATTTGGWNTLYLPFDVSSVSASGNAIDWFHSDSDKGKDFWLKTMTGDDNGTVYFNHANSLKANTPYIIALPGKDFGEKQLTEKAITFSGSNASIKATTTGSLNGNSYKFCGSTVGQTLSDVYLLNNNGNKFIKGGVTLPAFRAWIEPVSISSLSRSTLIIGESDIQGIDEMQMTNDDIQVSEGWYTLDGRRIMHSQSSTLKKGIYIHNGKKLIIR